VGKVQRQIEKLLQEIDETPVGPHERALIQQAIALADEAGDDLLGYRARMRLTQSANHSDDTETLLLSFHWCLAKHDADPERFPLQIDDMDLLFQHKWIVGHLAANSAFSLEQMEEIHESMARRFREAGAGPSAVLQSMFFNAMVTGRMEDATKIKAVLDVTPRDDWSHCEACTRSEAIEYAIRTNDADTAFGLYREMIEGDFSCGEEPEYTQANLMLPYLRAGELEMARTLHLQSYRAVSNTDADLTTISWHLIFTAVTGNEERGLQILERHLPYLANSGMDETERLRWFAASGLLLDAVAKVGHGDVLVSGSNDPRLVPFLGEHDGSWTVSELAAYSWQQADALAAKFDARNRNTAVSQRIADTRALANEHWDVPVEGPKAALPEVRNYITPQTADEAIEWIRTASRWLSAEDLLHRLEDSSHFEFEGYDAIVVDSFRVSALAGVGRLNEADVALDRMVAALRAQGHEDLADANAALGASVFHTVHDQDLPRLTALFEEYQQTRPGSHALRLIATVLANAYHERQNAEELERYSAIAEAVVTQLEPLGNERQAVAMLRVSAHMQRNDVQAAWDSIEPYLDEQVTPGAILAGMLLTAGQISGMVQEYDRGARCVDTAIGLLAQRGVAAAAISGARLAAKLHADAGRPSEAAARIRYAMKLAEQLEDVSQRPFRIELARYLLQADDPHLAEETIHPVLQELNDTEAEPSEWLEPLMVFGEIGHRKYEASQAWWAWNEGLNHAKASGDVESIYHFAMAIGRFLMQDLNDEESIDFLEQAVEAADQVGNPGLRIDALDLLGRARGKFGQEGGEQAVEIARELAQEHGFDWKAADLLDSLSRVVANGGDTQRAVSLALQANDEFAAVGDPVAGAVLGLGSAGNFLYQDGDYQAAYTLYRQGIEVAEAAIGKQGPTIDLAHRAAQAARQLGDAAAVAQLQAEYGVELSDEA